MVERAVELERFEPPAQRARLDRIGAPDDVTARAPPAAMLGQVEQILADPRDMAVPVGMPGGAFGGFAHFRMPAASSASIRASS